MNKVYKTVELPANVPGLGYSLKHRRVVQALIEYYCKRAIGKKDGNGEVFTKEDYIVMCNRGKCHDMDKVLSCLSYPQLTADYIHRMFNGHHIEGFIEQKCKYDWMEMIFDWESAPYTKPDKPLNAYEVATTFNMHIFKYVEPYLKLFGMSNERILIPEIKEIGNKKIYEEDLVNDFIDYIHTTHLHLLEGISRLDDIAYMKKFNSIVPFRHPSTQKINGTIHLRPNEYTKQNKFARDHEMINGVVDAQIFDIDKICQINVKDIEELNRKCRRIDEELRKDKLAR